MAYEGALLLDPTRKAILTQPTRLTSLAQIGRDRVTALLSGRLGHDTMAYHVALRASPCDLATWAKPLPSRPAGTVGGAIWKGRITRPFQSLAGGGYGPQSDSGGYRRPAMALAPG